jgi:CMP/dCMP kinase
MGYVITISGDLASGKTSVAKLLCARIGYKLLSSGDMHRSIARKLGMNSLQSNVYAELNPWIDERVDSALLASVADGSDYVVESRVAWYLLKDSLKVYLTVDANVGATRATFAAQKGDEPRYKDPEDAKMQLQARKASENRRFLAVYGIDCSDLNNYDVLVDTTHLTQEQVVEKVLGALMPWKGRRCEDTAR